MSAIQYRVSGIVDCFKVSQFASVTNYAERGCLCYSINSKNSYGGYTGSEFEVMEIRQTAKDTFRLIRKLSRYLGRLKIAPCRRATLTSHQG